MGTFKIRMKLCDSKPEAAKNEVLALETHGLILCYTCI